jgi:hypothetical protein
MGMVFNLEKTWLTNEANQKNHFAKASQGSPCGRRVAGMIGGLHDRMWEGICPWKHLR